MENPDFISKAVSTGDLTKAMVPSEAGLYCIMMKSGEADFQPPFADMFRQRRDPLLYIGKARGKGGLRRRLFDNELRNRGAGTFFRSLGVVLGHSERVRPLRAGRNFSFENAEEIARWIRTHLRVSWSVVPDGALDAEEKTLIRRYGPMLNIQHNPHRIEVLKEGRADCVRRARARYGGEERL